MRLEMFAHPALHSSTVSCFKAPSGIEPGAVVQRMRERHGILIGTGLDRIRATTLRVGHMGITSSPLYVLPTLSALELTLLDLGYRSEAGAGVAAATRFDPQAKALGEWLRSRVVDIPVELA